MKTAAADTARRTACVIVNAGKGDHRAARGIIGRAIREALGVTRWKSGVHFVAYYPAASDAHARYTLNVTDAELARVGAALEKLAAEGGWNRPPVEVFHD